MSNMQWDDEKVKEFHKYYIQACWGKSLDSVLEDFKELKSRKTWEAIPNGTIRCSDGAKFYVGSIIDMPSMTNVYSVGKIVSVKHNAKFDYCEASVNIEGLNKRINLLFCRPAKPLFTTEDGVAVYENDRPWVVHQGFLKLNGTADLLNNAKYHPAQGYRYFSTKDAALKYIQDNKKQFSLNDVKKALQEGKSYQYHETTINNLIKIAEGTYESN